MLILQHISLICKYVLTNGLLDSLIEYYLLSYYLNNTK